MRDFDISLTHRAPGIPASPAEAWFLPGADVDFWIRALCASGLGNLDSRPLFPVVATRSSRAAAGLFVPLSGARAPLPKRAIACGCLAGRIFAPAESELRYPLGEAEIQTLFLHDYVFWSPALGFTGFEAEDALTLPELLAPPVRRQGLWNRAHAGLLPEPDKLTISRLEPPGEFFETARGDIGSKPVEQLPGYQGEARDGLSAASRKAFYNAIRKLTGRVPAKAASPTWINRIEDWANDKLDAIRDRQQRQIDRLLALLESNPDEGLRYALPIGGEGHRGIAGPNDRLSRRDVDFNLDDLGGGRPVSPWVLDYDRTQRLTRRYREVANRELNLGRTRRAAYIFGNLLGDFESAASALKQGGFFGEAAVLYQKRLSNDRAAAECLKQGGLFEQAASVYEKLLEFETVGDMFAELGRQTEAVKAWERAVSRYASVDDDPCRAATLLEAKLGSPGRALQQLLDAWPGSKQARAALRQAFELRLRLGLHDEALHHVGNLRDAPADAGVTRSLAETLAEVAGFYTEAEVAHAAADSVRVLAGRQLEDHPVADASDVLRLVRSLEPDDLLLARDTRRLAESRAKPKLVDLPPRADAASVSCVVRQRQRFRTGFSASAAVATGKGFAVLGLRDSQITGATWTPSDGIQYAFSGEQSPVLRPLVLVAERFRQTVVAVCEIPLRPLFFANSPDSCCAIVPADEGILACAFDNSDNCWQLKLDGDELFLVVKGRSNEIRATHHLTPASLSAADFRAARTSMAVVGNAVFIAIGRTLARFDGSELQSVAMPSPVRALVTPPPHTRPRLAISMEDGAGIAWVDRDWRHIAFFAQNASEPALTFTRNGFLIAADNRLTRVFSIASERVEQRTAIPSLFAPLALAAGPAAGQFQAIGAREFVEYELR